MSQAFLPVSSGIDGRANGISQSGIAFFYITGLTHGETMGDT